MRPGIVGVRTEVPCLADSWDFVVRSRLQGDFASAHPFFGLRSRLCGRPVGLWEAAHGDGAPNG